MSVKIVRPISSLLSLLPHKHIVTGSILEGGTDILYYNLDRFSTTILNRPLEMFVRWYKYKSENIFFYFDELFLKFCH